MCISWTNKGLNTINMHGATTKIIDLYLNISVFTIHFQVITNSAKVWRYTMGVNGIVVNEDINGYKIYKDLKLCISVFTLMTVIITQHTKTKCTFPKLMF